MGEFSFGVDSGATWLRACLLEDGRPRWTARSKAVSWDQIPRALQALLKSKGLRRVSRVTVAGTHLDSAALRAILLKKLKSLSPRPRVLPDYEIAHAAAFGSGPGVVVVAGTGSIAFARGKSGVRRAGGFGPLLGDEGSGFWIGKTGLADERLRRSLRLPSPLKVAHASSPVRAAAAFAPRVLRASPEIRRRAAGHLAALAREAARDLGLPRPIPVALHGSVFKNAALRKIFLRGLGPGWREAPIRMPAERAAAL